MDFFIIIALFLLLIIAVSAWFGSRDGRKAKAHLERMAANPDLMKRVFREGPDGDGYVRLYVETVDGQILKVASHFDVDAAEKRLASQ